MALNIPTASLVVLMLAIFIIEPIKEGIGIRSEMWVYHGKANCYNFRISFAKNKTHCFCHYTRTLKNIYGTLPMQDKLKEYHSKREYDWSTIETLKHFPVHFGLIDAFTSAYSQFGVIV